MGMPAIDISGLPLFYVNKIISCSLDDGTVMVICGLKQGDNFTPLYATVSPASVALIDGRNYVETAQEAFNCSQMVPKVAH